MSANPYVGPGPFSADDHLYGRTEEANVLTDLILAHRVVLLYSPSGAGKSSLIESVIRERIAGEYGLLVPPTIRIGRRARGERRDRTGINRFLVSLAISRADRPPKLVALARNSVDAFLSELERSEMPTPVAGIVPGQPLQKAPSFLVFDQFEEVFGDAPDEETERSRIEFFSEIGEALRKRHRHALFAMREEYLANLDPYAGLVPTGFGNAFRLDFLRTDQAAEAIRKPAEGAGVHFEPGAVEQLTKELSKVTVDSPTGPVERPGIYVEPVHLQVVCLRLWKLLQRRDQVAPGALITMRDVGEVGAVAVALEEYYKDTIDTVVQKTRVSERRLRAWFDEELIDEASLRKQTRRRPPQVSSGPDTLKLLTDAFLIRSEKRGEATRWELAHDRLVMPVKRNNERWRERNPATYAAEAARWERAGRPDDMLLPKGAAEKAVNLTRETATKLEADFIKASLDHHTSDQRRRKWRLAQVVIGSGLLLLASLAWGFWQREKVRVAEAQALAESLGKDVEEVSGNLVDEKREHQALQAVFRSYAIHVRAEEERRDNEHDVARLLAVEAWRLREQQWGLDSANVRDQLIAPETIHVGLARSERPPATQGYAAQTLVGGAARQLVAASSLDGEFLAVGDETGALRIWQRSDRTWRDRGRWNDPQQSRVSAVVFAPNPEWLAVGSAAGDVHMLHLPELAATPLPRKHRRAVLSMSAGSGPRGPAFASAGEDGRVFMWWREGNQWRSGETLLNAGSPARTVALRGDGRALAAGLDDGTLLLWNALDWTRGAGGAPTSVKRHAPNKVRAVAFSADPRFLVSAGLFRSQAETHGEQTPREVGADQSGIILWDLSDPEWTTRPREVRADDVVSSIAFSGRDRRLVAGTRSGEILVWKFDDLESDAEGRTEATAIRRAHRGWVSGVAGAAARNVFVSVGDDGLARLWEASEEPCDRVPWVGEITSVAFVTPKAQAQGLATVGISRRDKGSGDIFMVPTHGSRFASEACPPETEPPLELPKEHPLGAWPTSLAMSPDGRSLAAGGPDSVLRLWTKSGTRWEKQTSTRLGSDGVWAVAWAPGCLASGGGQPSHSRSAARDAPAGEIRLFQAGKPLGVPGSSLFVSDSNEKRSITPVLSLAVSPDGTKLAAGTLRPGRVMVWEAATGGGPCEYQARKDLSFETEPQLKWQAGWDVKSVAFSPDSTLLAAGIDDGSIWIWLLTDPGQAPWKLIAGAPVKAIAFDPGGRYLVAGHANGQVLLWDRGPLKTPATLGFAGIDPVVIGTHKGPVNAVVFAPDGQTILSGGDDGKLKRWYTTSALAERVCGLVGRNLSQAEWKKHVGVGVEYACTCAGFPPEPSTGRTECPSP